MRDKRREKLIKLREKMLSDASLPLKKEANKLVFGAGDVMAEIVMIGEGPGYWEDQKGIPFVGRAGSLLNQFLSLIGLDRDKVFITNVVHHRPPENRDPTVEEIAAYRPYLDGIIDIIEPKVVVTLGRFSMAKFMPGVKISQMHGKERVVDWGKRKILVVPMYHPAAALRNGGVKELAKQDFLRLPEVLDLYSEQNDDTMGGDKQESEQMSLV